MMIASKKTSVSSKPKNPWPLPSLRLVLVCVSLAITVVTCALIIFVDVSAPSLDNIFLSTMYFPLGQEIQPKIRRWSFNKTECLYYFKVRDDSFLRADGIQCGQAVWQSTANLEEKDRYVKRISTNYRLFEHEHSAEKYFNEYWHEKLKDPLPTSFYSEETDSAPKAGEKFRAFRWDPLAVSHLTSGAKNSPWFHRATVTSRHIIYIFR